MLRERPPGVEGAPSTETREEASPGNRNDLLLRRKIARRRAARRANSDANGVSAGAPAAVDAAAGGSGAPLPGGLRQQFEGSLGTDLSGVRVHTGGPSQAAAASLGAHAYAQGQDIHFNAGQYDPSSKGGQHLLAHEVAHTVQQQGGGGAGAQAKLEVSAPGDAHELEADRAADAMVRGEATSVSGAGGLARQIMRAAGAEKAAVEAGQAGGGSVAEKAGADAADAVAKIKELLSGKKVVEKDVLATWATIPDKTRLDEATIVLAIDKLSAQAANQLRKDSGKGFTDAIAGEIAKVKKGWHDELKDLAEQIATCPDTDPRAKLRDVVKAGSTIAKSYKPRLNPVLPSTTLALGKPFPLIVTDEAAVATHKNMPGYEQPTFVWHLTVDEQTFGSQAIAPDAATAKTSSTTFTLTAKKAGPTKVTAEATALCKDGLIGKAPQEYQLTVVDAVADPNGFFEAKFKEDFKQIMTTDPFKPLVEQKDALASLFTKDQQTAILTYIDSKIVPPGLFTGDTHNKATGPQRVLLSSHMLTYGKVKLNDQDVDGTQWAASCCGGWVNGVFAYAGVNAAKGYGSNSKEQSVSPTGEKSYGAGASADDEKSNKPSAAVAAVNSANALLKQAKDREAKATKAGDTQTAATAHEAVALEEQEVAAAKAKLSAGKVAGGNSPGGIGNQNMGMDYLESSIKAGDWLYLDNNGAAGHSVIFADWADEKATEATEPDTATALANIPAWTNNAATQEAIKLETAPPRKISSRRAHVYNQPNSGGVYSTPKLGFPESRALGVDGVYAITHVRDDAQVASTTGDFLAIDVAAAIAANKKIVDANKLDLAAIKAKLTPIVAGLVSGLGSHVRPDKVGKVSGGLSAPQQKIADGILKGGIDDATDVANLVALGQKLGIIDIISGDPTHPNGKLDTSTGKWSAPWPTWKSDDAIKAK